MLWARPSHALDAPVVVEIAEGTESLLDAAATRRLIALELADVATHVDSSRRQHSALFFRVLRVARDLRVELWERGEFHGARLVLGTPSAGQLGARRVALAAAELLRRLQKKRRLQAERERVENAARAQFAAREARRTWDGPLALRPSLEFTDIGRRSAVLLGPRLLGQWTSAKRVRLDGGLSLLGGRSTHEANVEWLEWSLAPSVRVPVTDKLDLDLGLEFAAAWVRLGRVRGVDALLGQGETWSARLGAVFRIEPRLSRSVRLSLGAASGLVLRPIPFQPLASGAERLGGAWLALDLGVVITSH